METNWKCPNCGSGQVFAAGTLANEPTRFCKDCGHVADKEKFITKK